MTKAENLKTFERFVKQYGELCKRNGSAEIIEQAWDNIRQFKRCSEKAGATVEEIAEAFGRAMAAV